MSTRVVIGGPRNSGKSTLVASVYRTLEGEGVSVGLHEVDVYSDTIPCILGHKPWDKRKKRHHAWFKTTVEPRIAEFANDDHAVVLGDLPGKVNSTFLPRMIIPADHAIIVARDLESMEPWQKLFAAKCIPVALRVISYQGDLPVDRAAPKDLLFVGNLNRTVIATSEIVAVSRRISSLQQPARLVRTG